MKCISSSLYKVVICDRIDQKEKKLHRFAVIFIWLTRSEKMALPKFFRNTIMLPIRMTFVPVKVCFTTLQFVSHRIKRERRQVVEEREIIEVPDYAPAASNDVISLRNCEVQESESDSHGFNCQSFVSIGGIDVPPAEKLSQDPVEKEVPSFLNTHQQSSANRKGPIISQIAICLVPHSIHMQSEGCFSSLKASRNLVCSKLNLNSKINLSLTLEGVEGSNNMNRTITEENVKKGAQQELNENEQEKSEEIGDKKKSTGARRRRRRGKSGKITLRPDADYSSQSSIRAVVNKRSPDVNPKDPISVEWTSADGTKRVAHTFDDICLVFNPNHVPRNVDGSVKSPVESDTNGTASADGSSDSKCPNSDDHSRQTEATEKQMCLDGATSSCSRQVL